MILLSKEGIQNRHFGWWWSWKIVLDLSFSSRPICWKIWSYDWGLLSKGQLRCRWRANVNWNTGYSWTGACFQITINIDCLIDIIIFNNVIKCSNSIIWHLIYFRIHIKEWEICTTSPVMDFLWCTLWPIPLLWRTWKRDTKIYLIQR